jgi:hypothetical protein
MIDIHIKYNDEIENFYVNVEGLEEDNSDLMPIVITELEIIKQQFISFYNKYSMVNETRKFKLK